MKRDRATRYYRLKNAFRNISTLRVGGFFALWAVGGVGGFITFGRGVGLNSRVKFVGVVRVSVRGFRGVRVGALGISMVMKTRARGTPD